MKLPKAVNSVCHRQSHWIPSRSWHLPKDSHLSQNYWLWDCIFEGWLRWKSFSNPKRAGPRPWQPSVFLPLLSLPLPCRFNYLGLSCVLPPLWYVLVWTLPFHIGWGQGSSQRWHRDRAELFQGTRSDRMSVGTEKKAPRKVTFEDPTSPIKALKKLSPLTVLGITTHCNCFSLHPQNI